jgi:hypothetical protein
MRFVQSLEDLMQALAEASHRGCPACATLREAEDFLVETQQPAPRRALAQRILALLQEKAPFAYQAHRMARVLAVPLAERQGDVSVPRRARHH